MSYLVFVGVIISAAAALAIALQHGSPVGEKHKRWFAGVVFVGAILSAVGGCSMRSHEAQFRSQFEADLKLRTDQLLSTVTGGDGYCTVTFLRPFGDNGQAVVVNRGAVPLYDVTVRIADLDRMPDAGLDSTTGFREFWDSQTIIKIGNMPTDHMFFLPGPWDFSGDVRRRYRMFFGARNGSWVEDITLLRGDGNWSYTMSVSRGDSILYEHADSEYERILSEYIEQSAAP